MKRKKTTRRPKQLGGLFSAQIKIWATVYVRATSEKGARRKIRELQLRCPKAPGLMEGSVPICGAALNDPDLPVVSLSPAMSIDGDVGQHGETKIERVR